MNRAFIKDCKTAGMGAALAGVVFGLIESMGVLWGSKTLIPNVGSLISFSVFTSVLLASILGIGLALALTRARKGRPSTLGFHTGFFSGLWALLFFETTLMALVDPPPHQPGSPLQTPLLLLLPIGIVAVAFWKGLPNRRSLSGLASLVLLLPLLHMESPSAVGAPQNKSDQLTRLPNVLMVTLDTTRADHIGAYGYDRIDTPAFDGLAEEGVLFEEAFAQIPVTGPSHLGLFSGTGPWRHGNLLNGVPIPPEIRTLPVMLLESGYQTGAFVSAYVLNSDLGFDRGYQVYDDDFSGIHGTSRLLWSRLLSMWSRHQNPHAVVERRGEDTVDLALRWLDGRSADHPWMMWVHLFDAHGPYAPPAPFDTKYYAGDPRSAEHNSMDKVEGVADYLKDSLTGIRDVDWVRAQYDGEIAYADTQLQRLLDAVDARGEKQDTLVVVAGDHGESLGDNGVWFDHGDDLFSASTHVPLVISWPGQLVKGRRVKGPVELTDVLPTLTDLLRFPLPTDIDGQTLMGTWVTRSMRFQARGMGFDRAANLAARKAGTIDEPTHRMVFLRSKDMLYIHRDAEGVSDELYALDALEENRLALVREDEMGVKITDVLREQAEGLLQDGIQGVEQSNVPLSPAARARLKALGYIDD
jgi:arylsulfatase A-like enzyme